MTSQINMLKFKMPTDIGEDEKFLSHGQKMIEGKLLNCYAKEVSSNISALVMKNCNGCCIGHPSLWQHDCLMMESNK